MKQLLESPRLVIRQLTADDVDDLYAVYGDREAMQYVEDGEPLDRGACAHWVNVTQANYLKYGYGMSALVHRESGSVIGFCGIVHPGGQPEPELKYALKRQYWGHGFATEAAQAMIEYASREFRLSEIIATVAPENAGSLRVLQKAGMRPGPDRHEADGSITRVLKWSAGGAA